MSNRTELAERFRKVSLEKELKRLKQENEELKRKIRVMSSQRGSVVALLQRAERIIAKVVIEDAPGSL